MMGFGFGFGWIMMVIFWVVVVGLAVWLLSLLFPRVTHSNPAGGAPQHTGTLESPAEILKQRYARGEITQEQFEQMRRDVGA